MHVPHRSIRSHHLTPVLLLCLTWLACCLPAARAAKPGNDFGMHLLQVQIPANASLRRLDCEHLAAAVRAATLAHRKDAVAILSAALTLDEWDARRKEEDRLSCVCVSRLFHAAAVAAPDAAATLLETAEALYPECADALTAALRGLEASHEVAAVSREGSPSLAAPDGGTAGSNGTDGDLNGSGPSGAGVGPGFPGSPGFSGSSSSGSFALPTPVGVAVTVVVNK